MLKINKMTLKGFIMGIMVSILVATTIVPVSAAVIKEIKVVMQGINIYVDGNIQVPTDANGNVVEPMIYNGTTYLPVRALTNMLTDKEVSWDANTQTVFIGKKPDNGGKSVLMDALKPYRMGWCEMFTGKEAQFKLLDETQSPFNCLKLSYGSFSGTTKNTRIKAIYKLDSDYSTINGYFVVPYDSLGDKSTAVIQFYSVDQYGEKTLIQSFSTKAADEALKISVPVLGVNILQIEMAKSETSEWAAGAFYNVTLTTAE